MKRFTALLGAILAAQPLAAVAQGLGYDTDSFVKAIREKDNGQALEILKSNPGAINLRASNDDTPLVTAVSGRDSEWVAYLIQLGANPNLGGRGGETPLLAAARIGYDDAAEWLLSAGAKVDGENRKGETPLIVAVQQRHLPMVKLLLNAGANPDEADSVAGLSARDYAKRDSRMPAILKAIEAKKASAAR